jgi:signal transduction histidine kinase
MEFVNNYRNISSLKKMDFERFKVAELFYNLELLMKNNLSEKNIELTINIKPIDLELNADKKYIEQIFINLLKNSIDAVNTDQGKINLRGFKNRDNKVILEISDTGVGIPEEISDQIFIPFFTTKDNGSGIGLSLAQQIMRLHGGSISVQSEANKETVFTLKF